MEHWKSIAGFEDYEISDEGRVKSHKYGREAILKPRISHDGYVWYSLCKHGRGFTKRANRLVAEAFIPNPESKSTVNHIDGNKMNNSVDNLEWATREEQMRHAYDNGLKEPVVGCMQGNHVLSEDEVREIRRVYKSHDQKNGMRALARKYGVSESTIYKCAHRTTYSDVE
jgi:hypothetical protein